MDYQESLDFLFSQLPMFSRVGAAAYKPGLDTSIQLDEYFGNPHLSFKSIHVAGTNGKGSTSHNLASVLQQQGYKTGLYTSPHLADFRERIRINGQMIPEKNVIDFVERWKNCDYSGKPSFFELTMMMAFDWFAKERVDYAVIEVGMGGRLDSTNIITPIACVITNIDFDHTQFLGDTLPKIAAEKAGIIKSGIPVVIGHAEGEIRKVFEMKAGDVGAEIIFAEDTPELRDIEKEKDFTLRAMTAFGEVVSPLSGSYQIENLNTLLHTIEVLKERGVEIDDDSVRKGIENVVINTGLAGRWMKVRQNPLTICDTGHNRAGLSYTMPQLQALLEERRTTEPDARLWIVIGFVNDKDVAHIVDLLPKEAFYFVTRASVPRAMPVEELLPLLEKEGLRCLSVDNVADAYRTSLKEANPRSDIIFVGGSTFIVADFLVSEN